MSTQPNNRLAKAVATFIPDETLATVDVYTAKAKGVVNSIQDTLLDNGIDLGAIVRGGASAASMLPSIINRAGMVNKGTLLERIAAGSDLAKSVFSNMPAGLGQTASDYLKDARELVVSVSDVARLIDHTNFTDVRQVGQFVNRLSGSDVIGLNDPNAKAGLLIGVVSDCQRMGVKGVFNGLTNDLTGDLLNKVSAACADIGIKNADIDLLSDISDAMPEGFIRSVAPSAVRDFTRNYTRFETLNPVDPRAEFTRITTTFDSIDDKWLVARQDDGANANVIDASVFTKASPDFKNIVKDNVYLTTDPQMSDINAAFASTSLNVEITPVQSLRKQFPGTVLG